MERQAGDVGETCRAQQVNLMKLLFPTNAVSETDWALGEFMFHILPTICFTLYIVAVSGLHSIQGY